MIILPRQFFSDQKFAKDLIKCPQHDQLLKTKYVAYASLNAVASYLFKAYNLNLENVVTIKYHYNQDFLQMDTATCRSLSVFESHDTKQKQKMDCLFNMFSCATLIGKRYLRRRLFSPCANELKLSKMYEKLEQALKISTDHTSLCVQSLSSIKNIDVRVTNLNLHVRMMFQN